MQATERHIGVVGGSGFVGRAIVAELQRAGAVVVHLPRVELGGDLHATAVSYADHLDGIDAVVNAAGAAEPDSTDTARLRQLNTQLPLLLAEACELAGVPRLLHVSSAAVQGSRAMLDSTPETTPGSPYARSKADGESALAAFGRTSRLEICCYRPTSVQGVGRETTRRLVSRLSSVMVPIIGDGTAPLPLTTDRSVGRLAAALALAAGPVPAVVTHPWEGVTQRHLHRALGGRKSTWSVPAPLVRAGISIGSALARRSSRLEGPWRRVELLALGQGVASRSDELALLERIGFAVDHELLAAELDDIGRRTRRAVHSKASPSEHDGARQAYMLTELYWPETTSTGHTMTLMAEAMTGEIPVTVLTVPPTYSQAGRKAAASEIRNGVQIERLHAVNVGRSNRLFRVVSGTLISGSILLALLRRGRRGDLVLVVSNPFVLPFGAWAVAKLRRLDLVVITHDLFPDVLVAAEMMPPSHPLVRAFTALGRRQYGDARLILSIGNAQAARVRSIAGDRCAPIAVVPQAADLALITPGPRADAVLQYPNVSAVDRVVQIAGNLGPLQDTAAFAEALCAMSLASNLKVAFIGDGSERPALEKLVEQGRLPSVRLVEALPRDRVGDLHRACDAAIVMLKPGMVGVSVPSRIGNVLASGKPVIAVTGVGSELAELVERHRLGWVVEPRDWAALEAALDAVATASDDELAAIGHRVRAVAEQEYSPELMAERYVAAIRAAAGFDVDVRSDVPTGDTERGAVAQGRPVTMNVG